MKRIGALQITLPSEREISLTRVFDAPRNLVFDAYTKPELLKRWLGVMDRWSMAVCEVDLRVGGTYRYVWQGPNGAEMGMRGTFREIVPLERIVTTEAFDQAWYEGECIGTVTFVEQGGKTTITMRLRYDSQEVRDAVLKSPMADGVAAGFDTLAKVMATPPRRLGRSVAAVLVGFFAVAVLSLVTDQVFHVLDVYPPWGQPMWDRGDNMLAFGYRSIYTVVGGYLTARLAPSSPMRHVLALSILGFLGALAGAIATIPMDMGPDWYPVALVVTAIPLVWLGGVLHRRMQTA